jgi:2-polyprenyl-3-methyl-5-hydroxy-6-metoxy-1,4-benzoquinol methylase
MAIARQIEELKTSTATLSVKSACNICGTEGFTVIYPAGVAQVNQIVKCSGCGLMYANPRKEADHVEIESYPDDPNFDVERADPQRIEKERLQVRDLDDTREHLNDLYPARGRLVEIGSSFGYVLDSFRKDNWSVLGIEPNRWATKYASEKMQIETTKSTLEAAKLPDGFADVVVMLHVIEHVPDPVGTLREIWRVLKPGGHLILETPRYDTAMFWLLGRRERSISCDGHIFFFTSESLRKVYTAAGFQLERLNYTGRSLTLDRVVYNIGVISKSLILQRISASMSRRMHLQKIRITINLRDIQRVCLVKAVSKKC